MIEKEDVAAAAEEEEQEHEEKRSEQEQTRSSLDADKHMVSSRKKTARVSLSACVEVVVYRCLLSNRLSVSN